MEKILKAMTPALLAALAGCSSFDTGGQRVSPTHQWARADASVAKYNLHNTRCIGETDVNLRAASGTSPDFRAYRTCMEGLGYELVALAHPVSDRRQD